MTSHYSVNDDVNIIQYLRNLNKILNNIPSLNYLHMAGIKNNMMLIIKSRKILN